MPSVAELLADARLRLRLVAGRGAPDGQIRWAHATELLDPTEFLEGGELLLVTGVSLPDDDAGQADYVDRLATSGVAALGFGIGLSYASVPAALRAAADRRDLPVLEIPRPTPFVAITRAVARAIARQDVADKEFVLTAQRALTAAATGSGGTAAVLEEVVRSVGGWGLLLDRTGAVLAASPPEAVRQRSVLGADLARLRSAPGAASVVTHGARGAETWSQSLIAADELLGFLVVGRTGAATSTQRQAVNAAVPLLVLSLDRSRLVGRSTDRLRSSVLRLLLAGQLDLVEPISAELWNGLPEPPVTVIECRGSRFAVGAAVDRVLADRPVAMRKVLHARLDAGLVCVAAGADVGVVLRSLRPVGGLRVGVSEPGPIDDLEGARRQAVRAVEAGDGGGAGAAVTWFRDVRRSELLELVAGPAGTAFSEELLAPLRTDSSPVDLPGSLAVWLAHHGQWGPAAAELGIHRHTLHKRVKRAERLLGHPLDSPGLRAELWVALQIAGIGSRSR